MTREQIATIHWGKDHIVEDRYGIARQVTEVVIEGHRYYAARCTFGTPATHVRIDFFQTPAEAAEADISTMRNVCLSYTIR